MTYICIQAKEGSLGGYTMTDAGIYSKRQQAVRTDLFKQFLKRHMSQPF